MKIRLLTTLTATTLLAVPSAALAQGAMPKPGCFGVQVTDKSGDSTNDQTGETGSPSSDLVAGFITFEGGKGFANIQVDNLTEREIDPPYVALSWEFSMTTAAGPRYVRGYQDRSGTIKWTWGEPRLVTDDQTAPRAGGLTTGTLFPGKGGIIQIELPLAEADFGAKPGTPLKAFGLQTRQWVGTPAAMPNTGLPLYSYAPPFDDAAGKGSIMVGPCPTAPAPGSPSGPPAPGPVTPGTPGSPGTPGAPASNGSFDVKVTVPKLSAKKLKKAKRFTVKLSGNATELKAAVRKKLTGGKNLAQGQLATLKGSGKLTLKMKGKLKKGTYLLVFSGKNAQGQTAESVVKIKVKR